MPWARLWKASVARVSQGFHDCFQVWVVSGFLAFNRKLPSYLRIGDFPVVFQDFFITCFFINFVKALARFWGADRADPFGQRQPTACTGGTGRTLNPRLIALIPPGMAMNPEIRRNVD